MNDKKGNKKWIIYLILGGFIVELTRWLYQKISTSKELEDNRKRFC